MTTFDGVARGLGRLGRGVSVAARTVLPLDTNPVPAEWSHVTKVDPEDEKKLPLLYPLYLRHTDAVSVGGSAHVTPRNTEETFDLLAPASIPVFHEPSGPRQVTRQARERADLLAVPEVLNGDVESLVGDLGEATEYAREELVPDLLADELPWLPDAIADPLASVATSWLLAEAVFEAYVVQNPDSAAAREAGVSADDLLSPREAKQRAMAAERHLGSELVYLEYSGTYGGDEAAEILDRVSDALSWSRLWYGGGLDSREHAARMLDAGADAVVVGDAFHRVADEESEVCERAERELGTGAEAAAVDAWVREHVSVADSNAAAYLATIPSVSDPERFAQRYLTAAVRTWLGLRDRVADERSVTAASSLDAERLLGRTVAGLSEADLALVDCYLHALFADGRASGRSAALPTNHFAVSLSPE
ncbi:heptaprenylglyceryl phosphate synthase [Halorussus litoreus]|uniref:heptaprenylglyceryl phosphate synthase n=1 Tax=Halorussus litoreus TaxID=1710536 RepID=UPI000E252F63|nr:heptaprenylglyceryl phosphate synthase [Halorussus litoreus]